MSLMENERGHLRLARHPLGHAAPESATQTATGRRESDQIGAEGVGLQKDLLDGLTEADDALDWNPIHLRLDPMKLVEPFDGETGHFLIRVRDRSTVRTDDSLRDREHPQQPHA